MSITWQATVSYQTDRGIMDVVHNVAEIDDLPEAIYESAERVELGWNFDTVDQIVIKRIGYIEDPHMTVEQSQRL